MVIQPLIGNPYNGYINPYYWVDDHPPLHGNNESLDPSTNVGIHRPAPLSVRVPMDSIGSCDVYEIVCCDFNGTSISSSPKRNQGIRGINQYLFSSK